MFSVGDHVVYGENGVCTICKIAPLEMQGASPDKLYYYMTPLLGSGTYFTPVESGAFIREVMTREQALAFIDSIPSIEPAICTDNRFNHVDAFYREQFKKHTCEALVSVLKGLSLRMSDKKSKSSRAEITMKRARDILHGELSVALDIQIDQVEAFIVDRVGPLT